jgi:hypothetical protein
MERRSAPTKPQFGDKNRAGEVQKEKNNAIHDDGKSG